ncbi:MAG: hypothetical protein WBE92_07530 [Steroidobacteraceae bacterium]
MAGGQSNKPRFVGVRMSIADAEDLHRQALECGLTISELTRQRITGRTVISRTDTETASSIDRLSRVPKHLYPEGQGGANSEERKRWWALVTELERAARALYRSGTGSD